MTWKGQHARIDLMVKSHANSNSGECFTTIRERLKCHLGSMSTDGCCQVELLDGVLMHINRDHAEQQEWRMVCMAPRDA